MKEDTRSLAALHLAVMLFGLSAMLGRFVTVPAVLVAGGRVVCSAALLLVLCLGTRTPLALHSRRDTALVLVPGDWTPQNLAGVAVIGFAYTALAHSLYVAAQKRVKAQTAGLVSGMETVYSILYALVFLGEVPSPRALLGGAVILGVAVLSSLRPVR